MAKVIDSTNLGYLISKIKAAFWQKSDTSQVTIDSSPTSGSSNLVSSGGVYTAINSLTIPTIHSGTSDPSSSLGSDGDIYIKLSS